MFVGERQARSPVPLDVRIFAIESIERVVEAGKIISSDKLAAAFWKTLRGVLWTIKTQLEKQHQILSETEEGKVESLLNNLERICSWPRSTKRDISQWSRLSRRDASRWPTLTALKFPNNRISAAECLKKLIADGQYAVKRAEVLEKLKSFAARSMKNETAEVTRTSDISMIGQFPRVDRNLDDSIENLYEILKRYRSCDAAESRLEIVANIRLNGYKALPRGSGSAGFLADDAAAEFGVLLLDHPHAENGCWQETSIQICFPRLSNLPTIERPLDRGQPLTSHLSSVNPQHELICPKTFCRHISCRTQDLLCLSTRGDKFRYHKRSQVSRDWLASQGAAPLASAFTKPELKSYDKSKAILEMLVARATWQFYNSKAIGDGLTSDNVHFLIERRLGTNGVFVDEPMLLTRFDEEEDGETNNAGGQARRYCPPTEMIHDSPKILALGILLLEIETRKTMKKHRENANICPPGPFNINTNYRIANNLVATGPNAHPESIISDIDTRSPLITILPMCIKSGELKLRLQRKLSLQKDSIMDENEALRSIIYNDIVCPLETWARYYDLNRVKPLWEVTEAPVTRQLEQPTHTLVTQQVGFSNGTEIEKRLRSQLWFQQYEKLRDVLQPRQTETGKYYQPIKIAILDTGINQIDYDYLKDYPQEFNKHQTRYKYKDFVDTTANDKPFDRTGHGSAGVSLLVATCSNASLYIARVLENNMATLANVDTVVKGIDWAIEHEVDIITMAIGFERSQPQVEKAVARAHHRGILVFSAASNTGNIGAVCCPAIRTEHVFGVFSTDANIRESRTLNPSPISDHSFAIFGEDVELNQEGRPLVRGTSYATSIAAGLAGALLDFCQQNIETDQAPKLSELKERHKMKKIFQEMSKRDAGYLCIRPWKLLRGDLTDEHSRQKQREWIWGNIIRWLQPEELHERQ